ANSRAGRELQDPLARRPAGNVVLPLPRRVAYGERDDRALPRQAAVKRYLLLAAVAFSAAVHGFLSPEHLREEALLGALFVVGTAGELALVVLLATRPSRAAIVAATLALGTMLVAYLPFVLFRLPGFPMTPEPLERVALLTKGVELAGLAV